LKLLTEILEDVNKELNTLDTIIKGNNNNGFKLSEPIYLCTWNGGEIVEIHTKKTLFESYSDIKTEYENNQRTAHTDSTWNEIFNSLLDDVNDYNVHIEDNMTIQILKK
jgi:hypothetical protein